jgi:hypothetical protein
VQFRLRHCAEVEQEHKRSQRQYAHTYHYRDTICVCDDFWELPEAHRDGVLLHELGHLFAGDEGSEADANDAAKDLLGAKIEYVDSPYGPRLERLKNMAHYVRVIRRRNPGAEDPYSCGAV